jgi:tetratricopeptide (TPR) repeat protein
LRYDHRLFWAHINLGEVLALQGDSDGALASFRRAAALETDHPLPYLRAAELYLLKGTYGAALDCMKMARVRDSDSRCLKERLSNFDRLVATQKIFAKGHVVDGQQRAKGT